MLRTSKTKSLFPIVFGLLFLVCSNLAVAQTGVPTARLLASNEPIRPRTASFNLISPAATAPTLEQASQIERHAFDETNRARLKNGLTPFVWDADLCRMARAHSEDMGRNNFFSHVTSDGQRLKDRALAFGILHFTLLGENIAYNLGYDDPGTFAVERWMLSPKHRANILDQHFNAMAVGTFVAPDGSVYLTQTFIQR